MLARLQIDLDRKSLAEQVYQHVKRMILSEELKGGEKIPEERIAQAFGVSRTPIREALRKLERSGLVRIVPHSHAEVIRLEREDAGHIGEVRLELELLAVRRLARTAGPDDVAALRRLAAECAASAKSCDIASVFEKDNAFHQEIARRSGNPYVQEMLERLGDKIQLLRTTTCLRLAEIRRHIRWHGPILDAIEANHEAEAERAMKEHIIEAVSSLSVAAGEGRRARSGRA